MAPLELPLHPLVVALGTALRSRSHGEAKERFEAARKAALQAQAVANQGEDLAKKAAKAFASAPEASGQAAAARRHAENAVGAAKIEATNAAQHLAVEPTLPELAAFGGYLGGTTNAPPSTETWQILYLDAKLLTWLLVPRNHILFHQRMADDKAAFNQRDFIWVKADAPLARSSGPPRIWLSGDFTRAVDFTPPLTGGTAGAPPTGIFCEAATPPCCPPRTR